MASRLRNNETAPDYPSSPHKPQRKVYFGTIHTILNLQRQYPTAGWFRIQGYLLKDHQTQLGQTTLKKVMKLDRRLHLIPKIERSVEEAEPKEPPPRSKEPFTYAFIDIRYLDVKPAGVQLYSCLRTLSIILAGHPKLKNDLRRPTMEEIGYRTTVFSLDNLIGKQREYLEWLMNACTSEDTNVSDVLETAALELIAARLKTPLQIEQHLTLAYEAAFQAGEKPVSATVVESVLSKQLDDLEPTLTRHGYSVKSLAEQFGAKPTEIRALFRGQLEAARMRELQDQMLAAGLPL